MPTSRSSPARRRGSRSGRTCICRTPRCCWAGVGCCGATTRSTGTCCETRDAAGADDTVICLGDVAHPDAWRDDRLVLDVAECPGELLLVLGNHDVDPVNQVRPFEVGRTTVPLYAAGDPPLLLTPVHAAEVRSGAAAPQRDDPAVLLAVELELGVSMVPVASPSCNHTAPDAFDSTRGERLLALVVRIIEHRDIDRLARLARSERQRPRRRHVVVAGVCAAVARPVVHGHLRRLRRD